MCMHMYICMYVFMHGGVYIWCMHIYVHVCVSMYVCVYMSVWICVSCDYVCMGMRAYGHISNLQHAVVDYECRL